MKLKLAEKIITKEALEEAITELHTVCYNEGHLQEALYFAKRQFTLDNDGNCEITDDNFWQIREGLRTQIPYILRAADRTAQFTLEDQANLTETETASDFRFLLPAETSDNLHNYHENDIFRRLNDKFFIRVSNEDHNMMSCFFNEKMARADRRTKLKPGRLLTKVLGYTNNEKVKSLVTIFEEETKPVVVHIAYSAKEIINVYENGPNSCMCRKGWADVNHPVQVYAHPNLCVAYIKKPNGNVSARAVIRTDKSEIEYIRLYGDETKLQLALAALNIYQSPNGLQGIQFEAIYRKGYKNRVIMPYLDGGQLTLSAQRNTLTVCSTQAAEKINNSWVNSDGTSGIINHPDIIACHETNAYHWKDELFRVACDENAVHDYFFSLAGLISTNAVFAELKTKEGNKLWFADTIEKRENALIEGEYYKVSDLDYFNFIEFSGKYYSKDSMLVGKCEYSGLIGLKKDMVKINSKYYLQLPQHIKSTYFLNAETGNLVKRKRKGMKTIQEIKQYMVSVYSEPLYVNEVFVEYPKASLTMAQAIIT